MQKSLDRKLAAIHADPQGCREFIIADAKDADMAFGIGAPGRSPERHDGEARYKTLAEFREQIRQIVRQEVVDIMLMSASTSEVLTLQERIFDDSPVTPAIRANDTTDIHAFRGSRIPEAPSRPFRTASLDHVQCGYLDCAPEERSRGVDLGLYSMTFNNDCELDLATLEAYGRFREEAERKGFRHFLEVFNPNLPAAVPADLLPFFINDVIARTLAGVTSASRPIFLKIPYPGPKALEELVAYDPHLIVGILGGSSGTTRDAFQLIHDAHQHGGRVALFGRKINNAENQLAFIEFLRHVVDGVIAPDEAVRAYHAVLAKLGLTPHRPLEEDLMVTAGVMSYAGSPPPGSSQQTTAQQPEKAPRVRQERPNVAAMTPDERLAYHQDRLRRMFDGDSEHT
ncbi:MAG: hypothetical protein DWQ34_09820 [Planctomycetota bacterium]|nr:MAG: hypothetical protein DWQ34_09820 [Planctomycetota bacterium]REJ94066.1 MAG: hypothetical protein DWQ29_03290 [Planctomycetota bacterium]REK21130.1 MAG: hypothetical protein DWQ41_22210 [Planctomycetota bacterium]REK29539.1 MAG: hypothetical protein DWQ45_22245 [Planctomycetota bacterium]